MISLALSLSPPHPRGVDLVVVLLEQAAVHRLHVGDRLLRHAVRRGGASATAAAAAVAAAGGGGRRRALLLLLLLLLLERRAAAGAGGGGADDAGRACGARVVQGGGGERRRAASSGVRRQQQEQGGPNCLAPQPHESQASACHDAAISHPNRLARWLVDARKAHLWSSSASHAPPLPARSSSRQLCEDALLRTLQMYVAGRQGRFVLTERHTTPPDQRRAASVRALPPLVPLGQCCRRQLRDSSAT